MAAIGTKFFLVTWNCQGLSNNASIPTQINYFRKSDTERPYIVCLQETSVYDAAQKDEAHLKIGRDVLAGRGTNKDLSGNQRCNTAIFWSEHFKYHDRHAKFHGNRFYEMVKLEISGKAFWLASVHMPSGPPGNAAHLCGEIIKISQERAPLITAGDMNCEPSGYTALGDEKKIGKVSNSGKPTHKCGKELDWMVVRCAGSLVHIAPTCLGVPEAYVSDHLPVGFDMQIW